MAIIGVIAKVIIRVTVNPIAEAITIIEKLAFIAIVLIKIVPMQFSTLLIPNVWLKDGIRLNS